MAPGSYAVEAARDGAKLETSVVECGWGKPEEIREATEEEKQAASEVKRLVAVEEHRMRDGETLESVAKAAGMTREDLAFFNWGTRDAKEIHTHLAVDFGSPSPQPPPETARCPAEPLVLKVLGYSPARGDARRPVRRWKEATSRSP